MIAVVQDGGCWGVGFVVAAGLALEVVRFAALQRRWVFWGTAWPFPPLFLRNKRIADQGVDLINSLAST